MSENIARTAGARLSPYSGLVGHPDIGVGAYD